MKHKIDYAHSCPDTGLLREFCSYDIQCPECCELVLHDGYYHISPLAMTSLHWSRQYEYPWAILNSNFKPADVCLDAGGGYSVFKYSLAKRSSRVVTIDINKESLEKSVLSAKNIGFNNIEFIHCGIEEHRPGYKYDKIYCLSVIEHIKDKKTRFDCLGNMMNILKPGGELLLSFDVNVTPTGEPYDFYVDINNLSEMMHFLDISDFDFYSTIDTPMSSAGFPKGVSLITMCVKIQK
mgnify:CR=1 FL=1